MPVRCTSCTSWTDNAKRCEVCGHQLPQPGAELDRDLEPLPHPATDRRPVQKTRQPGSAKAAAKRTWSAANSLWTALAVVIALTWLFYGASNDAHARCGIYRLSGEGGVLGTVACALAH